MEGRAAIRGCIPEGPSWATRRPPVPATIGRNLEPGNLEPANLQSAACPHGGDFFKAVGEEFDHLEQRSDVINADVLDAWFPPAPGVVSTLREYLPWLLQTSPPTQSEGLTRAIARARGLEADSVLPAGGSSNLIFLALRQWLTPGSRALVLDPTYGEYAHVLEHLVGCRVDRFPLFREDAYAVVPGRLGEALARGAYDFVALVNPNSPTGQVINRPDLERILAAAPSRTRFWIDETYTDYAGPGQSLERFAAASENVVVCKSMSKVYALSGARVAYLAGPPALLGELRRLTPPWAVSLLGQVAGVRALEDPAYYAGRWQETAVLRDELASRLRGLGLDVQPSTANFLLFHLPETGPTAAEVQERCRARGLYLRDGGTITPHLGDRCLRTAVKSAETNARILEILAGALA